MAPGLTLQSDYYYYTYESDAVMSAASAAHIDYHLI